MAINFQNQRIRNGRVDIIPDNILSLVNKGYIDSEVAAVAATVLDSDHIIAIINEVVDSDFLDTIIDTNLIQDEVQHHIDLALASFDDSDFVDGKINAARVELDSDIQAVDDAIEVRDVVDNRSSQLVTDFRINWNEVTGTLTLTDGPPGGGGGGSGVPSLTLAVASGSDYSRTTLDSDSRIIQFNITYNNTFTLDSEGQVEVTNGRILSAGALNGAAWRVQADSGVSDVTLSIRDVTGTHGTGQVDSDISASGVVEGYVPLWYSVGTSVPASVTAMTMHNQEADDVSSFTFSGADGNTAYIASTSAYAWRFLGFPIDTPVVGTGTLNIGTATFNYSIYQVSDPDISGSTYTITK